jgi:hypothetical protein
MAASERGESEARALPRDHPPAEHAIATATVAGA